MPTSPDSIDYWLKHEGGEVYLRGGQLLVGRSAMCRLVLDDPLVSRQHAEFRIEDGEVALYDLDSANGVYVNGDRIEHRAMLKAGDKIAIGEQLLTLVARSLEPKTSPHLNNQRFLETLHDPAAQTPAGGRAEAPPKPSGSPARSGASHHSDALELLGAVADKVLALGRGDEAERILSNHLNQLLEVARRSKGVSVAPANANAAVGYAVKLASVTGKGQWIDYTFQLFQILRRPLPSSAIDEMYNVLRRVRGVSLGVLREYVATLHSVQSEFGPADRFLVQRIEGLERLAALR